MLLFNFKKILYKKIVKIRINRKHQLSQLLNGDKCKQKFDFDFASYPI